MPSISDQISIAYNYIWDVATLSWIAMNQPLLKTDSLAVTGTFYQATQPVSIATMPSTPVTGTFWQATQPVSIATMPTTPVTGTFWQATQPVSIATMPSTPVTGTFWQAAQPVTQSGVWTVQPGNTANTTAWKVDGSGVTQPVSGTFWQATQPVSLTTIPNPSNLDAAASTLATQATLAKLAIAQGTAASDSTGPLTTGPMVQAVVMDATPQYIDTEVRPLQLAADGRLRVATMSESLNLSAWGEPEQFDILGAHAYPLSVW